MFVPPQNSYVEILTPSVMVYIGESLEKCLGLENRALIMGLVPLIKKPQRAVSLFPTCEDTTGSRQSANQKRTFRT